MLLVSMPASRQEMGLRSPSVQSALDHFVVPGWLGVLVPVAGAHIQEHLWFPWKDRSGDTTAPDGPDLDTDEVTSPQSPPLSSSILAEAAIPIWISVR